MPSGSQRAAILAVLATVCSAAVLIAAGCGDSGSGGTVEAQSATQGAAEQPSEEQPLSPSEQHGRELFIENCGSCHTLDAAGTTGQIGPDLGNIPLGSANVLRAIKIGGRGSGTMPRDLVSGQDAADVAAFVAASGPG
jgi:mono/diheme cytochrome c family protein